MADSHTPLAPPPRTAATPRQIPVTTPSRRAYSAGPATSLRRAPLRTPGSTARNPANGPRATTPHGRAAIRALDSRRAAIFTPGRRRSLRDLRRETPRDLLRALSRNLAPKTEPVRTSSSPGGDGGGVKSEAGDESGTGFMDDDDDDDRPLRVPRMSLPIDEDDDEEEWPRPHRSAGLEDENFTVQSIETPRRAYSEGPSRFSLNAGRMSDVYQRYDAGGGLRDEDDGNDSSLFPPLHAVDDDGATRRLDEETEYERYEAEDARRRSRRQESDFGMVIEAPEGNDETTVFLQPELVDETVIGVGNGPADEPLVLEDEPLFLDEESHVHFADDVVGGDEEEQDEDAQDGGELDEDAEAEEYTMEVDSATAINAAVAATKARKKKRAGVKVSRYGIPYPSLPPATVKRLAQTFAKTSGVKGKISPDTLAAIMQASEWFFEQLGDDLQAYAKHAGRKTIDESDMLQIMKRQRLINASTTPFSLGQRYLPRELLQELRLPPPAPIRKSRTAKSRANDDDPEEVT